MIKESALRKFALVFGILCTIGFIVCLAFAVTLPRSAVYNTAFGTVRATSSGSFDINFLAPIIILIMGAYVGFSMFACIRSDKKPERKEKECKCGEKPEISVLQESEKKKEESGVRANLLSPGKPGLFFYDPQYKTLQVLALRE